MEKSIKNLYSVFFAVWVIFLGWAELVLVKNFNSQPSMLKEISIVTPEGGKFTSTSISSTHSFEKKEKTVTPKLSESYLIFVLGQLTFLIIFSGTICYFLYIINEFLYITNEGKEKSKNEEQKNLVQQPK